MGVSLNNTLTCLVKTNITCLSFLFPEYMTFEMNDLEIIEVVFYLETLITQITHNYMLIVKMKYTI